MLIVFLTLLAIALPTLYPYDFFVWETLADFSWQAFWMESHHPSWVAKELIANVLLFIPFGISCQGYLWSKSRSAKDRASHRDMLIKVAIASLIASLIIEFLQIFLPTRHPSYIDLVNNTLGGVVGGILGIYQCRYHRVWQPIFRSWTRPKTQHRLAVWALVGYTLSALALSMALSAASQSKTTTPWGLQNWDSTYFLAIGNELTGDRPWTGHIHTLQIYSQPLSLPALYKLLTHSENIATKPFPLMHYAFTGTATTAPFPNLSRHVMPALTWQSPSNSDASIPLVPHPTTKPAGLPVGPQRWLQTATPASALVQSIQASQAFTLDFELASVV